MSSNQSPKADQADQAEKQGKRLAGVGLLVVVILILAILVLVAVLSVRDAVRGSRVAANFTRVGGPTRVETAVDASRFWLTPPACFVTIPADADQAAMFGAARRAMAYDAPLLFISRNPKRRRLVRATIDSWQTVPLISRSPEQPLAGGSSQPEAMPTSCPRNGHAASRVSTPEVSSQLLQYRLPITVRDTLAPNVVFAVARAPGDAPDVAVGLALAAHMAAAPKATALRVVSGVVTRDFATITVLRRVAAPRPVVSLVVVPRFLETDAGLEDQLRNQHELVQGGVVLGSAGILTEDTHVLLRQILTSTDQQSVLSQIGTNLGLIGSLLVGLLALVGLGTAAAVTTAGAIRKGLDIPPRSEPGAVQLPPSSARRLWRLAPRPAMLAGREELLAGLDAQLTGGEGGWPRVVVLSGLGGVGKTSVAVEHAYRHRGDLGVAWQLPAEDDTVLVSGFGELAAQLGAGGKAAGGDPVAAVHSALAAYPGQWLLIFDNAPRQESVRAFLPPAGNGRVLITSQSAVWPRGQAVEVPVLGTEAAAELLVNRTGDPDREAAAALAAELGGLPLALEQAAAYIQTAGMTLAGYLTLFRDRRVDLLARGEAAGHPETVAETLGLALSRLEAEAPAAAGLLRLLACLAPEPVPLALLLADAQAAGALDPAVAAVLGPLLGDSVAARDAVAALRRFSLVTLAGDGLVLVHRLVQAITLGQTPVDLRQQWQQAAVALVEAVIPADTRLPASWPVCAVLLPHARAVLGPASGGSWRIAQYLGYSGQYLAARGLAQEIAAARSADNDYGPEHPDTLTVRAGLARWTGEAGDAAGARDQFAALLPICERVLGPEHPDTLTVRVGLARWTGEAGDAAGARDQFAALLPICERVLGPEHPDTLTVRVGLARWTGEAGDAAGARDQFAALLPICERVLGPEHPDTLTVRVGLARWTGEAGDAAGARDQFAALLPICERVLGPDHPDTLTVRVGLARWTGEAGDAAGARDQFAALLPICERMLGPDHPDTLTTRAGLARWTGEAGSP